MIISRVALLVIGLYFSAGTAGCVSPPKESSHRFVPHDFSPLTRMIRNQVHGNVRHVLEPTSFVDVEGDCLYQFRESFRDSSGNAIKEMIASGEQDLLLMLNGKNCKQPAEPLIKLAGMDYEQYLAIRQNIHALLDPPDLSDASSVTIEKLLENYQVTFVTSRDTRSLVVSLDDKSTGPVILSSDAWQ